MLQTPNQASECRAGTPGLAGAPGNPGTPQPKCVDVEVNFLSLGSLTINATGGDGGKGGAGGIGGRGGRASLGSVGLDSCRGGKGRPRRTSGTRWELADEEEKLS